MTGNSEHTPTNPRAAILHGLEVAFVDLGNEMRRRYAQASEVVQPGLSPASYRLLLVIRRAGALTLSELAGRLCADKGMTSRNVTELESHGLVERVPDPADRRARLINITDHGAERLEVAHATYALSFDEVLADWPVEAIEQTTRLLETLVASSDDVPENRTGK